MKIGIFTPVHKLDKKHLTQVIDLALSINDQSYSNFEWVILLNGEAKNEESQLREAITEYTPLREQVKIYSTDTTNNIGKLKSECCKRLNSDVFLEVDFDDLLHKHCLLHIEQAATKNPKAVFFYSNFAHFGWKTVNKELVFESFTYGEYYGWKSRPHINEDLFAGLQLNETIQFPATAQYLYRIESAPNHFRAFRAEPYRNIGGYDESLEVGDDHDLMCRFYKEYGEEGFYHIDKCLYYQRYDASTTTHTRNSDIQQQVDKNYIRHSEDIFKRWANDRDLLCLDLGGRFNCPKGYKSVDLLDADYIIDLNTVPWQVKGKSDVGLYTIDKGIEEGHFYTRVADNSVGVIRAYHLLEHLDNPIDFFNEAYRVLAPGGFLLIEVPSARDYHAFADPTHKSFWTELNFEYYTKENKARFIRPQFKGAFQTMRMTEYAWPDGTLCISAQLVALKGWYNDRHWGDKQTDEKYIQ